MEWLPGKSHFNHSLLQGKNDKKVNEALNNKTTAITN